MKPPRETGERFWEKVDKSGDCWLWVASRCRNGYGKFGGRNGWEQAHRVAWRLTHGPIPDGLLVCHRCDNRQCVRPDHLFLGSQRDNMHDASTKGRINSWNARKTHCKHGHEFTPENTVIVRNGRGCRTCKRAYELRLYYRKRSQRALASEGV